MYQEYCVTYYNNNDWKLPLNLAIGFHLILIVGAIYLPDLFQSKPRFQDIYTVDLINIAEPVIEEATAPKTPPPQKAPLVPETPVTKKAISIAESAPTPPATPVKAISIKPLKRKIKKKIIKKTKKIDESKKRKELEKIRRQRLAEALRDEELASEKAKIAAEDAVNELKQMLRTTTSESSNNSTPPKSESASRKSGGSTSVLENQYLASLANRLQQFWSLPEYKVWDSALTAVVVITLRKDGTVSSQFFEKRSGDRFFDQFVQKTLQDAVPLPPIPPALKIERKEIGFIFTPSGIQR